MGTVKDITFDLCRKLGLTTIVGNPGSTEESFLKNFPKDFEYILALQEASVVTIADGLSQGLRKPILVNIHTAAGLGNAMGSIMAAYQNKTPLIITAGQQTREMLLLEAFLTNIEPIIMPKPWVKWSYEPVRPEDVPASLMRAYATAVQEPQGPVFLSLPFDDWDKEINETPFVRTLSMRVGPDPVKIQEFAHRINASKNPVLIYGADIVRNEAWHGSIQFAERINSNVWSGPFSERTPFPETHRLYAGALPPAIGPLSEKLEGHDLIVVIGAPVFRYYPFVKGSYIPKNAELLHVTDDPNISSKAPLGDSLVSNTKLFFESILPHISQRKNNPQTLVEVEFELFAPVSEECPLSANRVFEIIAPLCPKEFVVVEESPSNIKEFQNHFKIDKPDSFYRNASGGLGWAMPAAVGLALSEKKTGRERPIVVFVGDGSFQYSVQSIYTGVQHNAHIIFIVLRNKEYAILKKFAVFSHTPNVPGLDLPALDIVSLGKGYGAKSIFAKSRNEIESAVKTALIFKGTSVIEIPIKKEVGSLL